MNVKYNKVSIPHVDQRDHKWLVAGSNMRDQI